ncbi:MAG: endolytic transglycosylase MltG [Proteobacteria bacterium]|nr:endolytic transglycosylase MltG [Pseudomonadota bacterium]
MLNKRFSLIFLYLIFLGIRCYRFLVKCLRIYFHHFWKLSLLFISILVLIVALWQVWQWQNFAKMPFNTKENTTIILTPDMSVKQLANNLHDRGLLADPKFLVFLAHRLSVANRLRMGEYAIGPKTTPEQLLRNMVAGKVVMRKLTLVEGTTMRQIREILAKNAALRHVAIKQTDQELMTAIGHPGESPEGHFFPDTYVYTWGNKDTLILQRAYNRMSTVLNQNWSQRQNDLPYQSPQEALIVASLVESEAVVPAERPIIAGVILRRLQMKMNLQVDPTVIYGVGKPYGSVITLEDLRNDNPYNTYLHSGLPPTPINMPSAASIYAAFHPASGDALYYVARGDGSHRFSATYTEHLQAVQKYRQFKKSEATQQKWFEFTLFIARATGLY